MTQNTQGPRPIFRANRHGVNYCKRFISGNHIYRYLGTWSRWTTLRTLLWGFSQIPCSRFARLST